MRDVFLTFLRLGLTSFGGPIAHLGYFRREFVERRGWIDERLFTQIVAFCSILPGPTSSQVGLLVGLLRGGAAGAFAAWVGFTLPSAVALTIFALALTRFETSGLAANAAQPHWFAGVLGGLGAAAVGIVAQAVASMMKTQCPDRMTRTIAAGAAAFTLALASGTAWQWLPIAAAALAGAFVPPRTASAPGAGEPVLPIRLPRWVPVGAGLLFAALVIAAVIAAQVSAAGLLLATLVRAGALVFGGGHVVLPLLRSLVANGLISEPNFIAGYGATQAVPGPLFTFAAFLGAANDSPLHGLAGAAVATVLIFVPSFLLVFALLPGLNALRSNPAAAGALRGANAGVVGVLGAVLYSPRIVGLGSSLPLLTIALAAFTLVTVWHTPPWIVVGLAVAAGALT